MDYTESRHILLNQTCMITLAAKLLEIRQEIHDSGGHDEIVEPYHKGLTIVFKRLETDVEKVAREEGVPTWDVKRIQQQQDRRDGSIAELRMNAEQLGFTLVEKE